MASYISCTRFSILYFLFLTFFTITKAHFIENSIDNNKAKALEKLTKLHSYFHDIPYGKNPTAVIIARPAKQKNIGFGTLVMIDDPLTEGPDPETSSKLVGRAQGMYGEAGLNTGSVQDVSSLLMSMTFFFTQEHYNGSSISILGRYRVSDEQREMPIVGGTGVFRLARGYVLAKTYQYDPKTGVAVSEYNVFVLH